MLSTVLVVVTFAAMVQTALGMGFGLTAAPVLALIDPVLVPVPALYIGTATALAATLNERSAVVWSEVKTGHDRQAHRHRLWRDFVTADDQPRDVFTAVRHGNPSRCRVVDCRVAA